MKSVINLLLGLSALLFSPFLSAQSIRGVHVDDFRNILGYPDRERELLTFAEDLDFNYLLLYNLGFINRDVYDLSDPAGGSTLASFIRRAKQEYGIEQIGIVGEKASSFDWTVAFRHNFPDVHIDVYHLEFEFWNPNMIERYYCSTYLEERELECSVDGAFEYYQGELEKVRWMADAADAECETYLGNTTYEQGAIIGAICDRVLVHFYRKSDLYNNGNSIYQYKPERLEALVASGQPLRVVPLFSGRKKFMGPWLLENPLEQAFSTFLMGQNGFAEQEGAWKDLVTIEGYHWHRYSDLNHYLNSTKPGGDILTEQFFYRRHRGVAETSTRSSEPDPFVEDPSAPQLFPNPAYNELQLDAQGREIVRVEIYLPNGELYDFVEAEQLGQQRIDVSQWPEGLFLIKTYLREADSSGVQPVFVRRE
ncbi:MAG: hypothetical protein AAFW73_04745 [Bacteroidota bacterium]